MLNYFYQLSNTHVFFILALLTTAFAWCLILINKSFVFPHLKYRNNVITASTCSLIGIIYGVVAGFLCLYLINNNDHASRAVLNEGLAASNIYRDSKWLKEPFQQQIQKQLKQYIVNVIDVEWPEMKKGLAISKEDGYLLNRMAEQLTDYPITTPSDPIIVADLIQEFKALFNARQDRIEMSGTQLSPEIWQVIIIGTILIIVVNYGFRGNFYLHAFNITAFAVMAASVLFLLVTLDRPYQGEFSVEPDALRTALDFMSHDNS